jgi:pyrimidine-nucleoside phosphorylase
MIEAQGGDVTMVDDPSLLPQARIQREFRASQSGAIAQVDALAVAGAAFELGAGRETKEDTIDVAVGVKVHVKTGTQVEEGDLLATVYANDEGKLASSLTQLEQAFTYSETPVNPLPLFYDVISSR